MSIAEASYVEEEFAAEDLLELANKRLWQYTQDGDSPIDANVLSELERFASHIGEHPATLAYRLIQGEQIRGIVRCLYVSQC